MKILIVDDEKAFADAVAAMLEDENYQVGIAYDGESGLNEILTNIYDLIILDVMLPRINGYEIAKKLRCLKISVPVIMLSARSSLDDKIEGLDCGADDYLTKPFHSRELLARIRALTRRRDKIVNDSLAFGDISLNRYTLELECSNSGENIKLASKEYILMELFISNAGQILTREQIALKVWGYENNSEYNNVEVYVSFLRKKIGFIGSSVRIRAVRGVGYVLEE
ncbi:MAG: response regulator transcription factor [Oscillospiraceae bacterium]|nr:response regulator transcription factor [Oscillospiraceae bacterium]